MQLRYSEQLQSAETPIFQTHRQMMPDRRFVSLQVVNDRQ